MKNILKKLIPNFIFSWYHWLLAYLGALVYGFPSRKLIVIGVTGTKGKTTTCNLIAQILQGAGFKTGMATTVNFRIRDKEWINDYKQTMLGRFKLQKLLRQMVSEGCKYAVIETSSEGILQHRHKGINYSVAVFTNLSPEHIERHGSFENYRAAKLKLFEAVAKKKNGIGVYNLDDESTEYFLKIPMAKKMGYFLKSPLAPPKGGESLPPFREGWGGFGKLQIANIKLASDRTEFDFNSENFITPLIGEVNMYNAAAAICVAISQGIGVDKIKEALKNAKPAPGRLEVINEGQPFTVIVDYAHEPASLESAYKALKIFNPRKIIALLGAQGGGRDKSKRAALGRLAGEYADYVIITNEDPYDEDPTQILSEIKSGISNTQLPISNVYEILDRREAIKKALSLAKAGDAVILTGKGGEVWMCVENGKKIPWQESEIVKEELRGMR
ncbi:MAG: UDP-N-acetylmuramoyl-L-alanyl-D-glutamate--2,6-diaminopimelate ligase [Candidatus Portnoybacteria bacterium]|nr:UDP-N-acetylmuramoyl-L-alanyl-D-glutamate--2,6-diaminopimelate ligase [Candidatus Portnoybacteria bacterium]